MKLVADTSALIAVISNEPIKDRLIAVSAGADLVAPASVHWEVGNAIAAGFKRRRFTLDEAIRTLESYDQIQIRYLDVALRDAVTIAHRLGIYAYDAFVLACARDERCPILTLDGSLARAAEELGVAIQEVEQ